MVCSFFSSPLVGPEVVEAVAQLLSQRTARAEQSTDAATCFDSPQPPQISLHDYAMRLLKRFKCSPECLVLSLVYIDRLAALGVGLRATNVHRLLLTTVVVAAKVFDDTSFTNSSYARVAGVSGEQLNEMESCLLERVSWHVHVTREVYDKYLSCLAAVESQASEPLAEAVVNPPEISVAPAAAAEVTTVASSSSSPLPVADRLPVGCPPLRRAPRPRAVPRTRCRGQRKADERQTRCPQHAAKHQGTQIHEGSTIDVH